MLFEMRMPYLRQHQESGMASANVSQLLKKHEGFEIATIARDTPS